MPDKSFKTIEEQLEILRSRGLTIDDEDVAKEFLLWNNYYRVSGYSLTLRKNDIFYKSAVSRTLWISTISTTSSGTSSSSIWK